MKKLRTLYIKNPNDLSRVTNELDQECAWVFEEGVVATQKFDGTACMILDGVLYKRYDNKKGKKMSSLDIECQEADEISGHHPYWVMCNRDEKSEKYHWEAFDKYLTYENPSPDWEDGTYELIGEKIQGNPEGIIGHELVKHGTVSWNERDTHWMLSDLDNLKAFLENEDIEGIVFYHPDGRMCKIRKKDFGMIR